MTIFPTRILFASDGSEDSELAATTTVGLAKITGSELHVLHVAPAFPDYFEPSDPQPGPTEREARRTLDEQVKKIENVGGTVTQSHLRRGGAAEEVIEQAEELQTGLIVLGSRGRGRIRRALMGSVSDSVVRHAHCPVMVVGSRGLGGVRRARMGSVSDSVVRHAHCPVLVVRREGRQEPV